MTGVKCLVSSCPLTLVRARRQHLVDVLNGQRGVQQAEDEEGGKVLAHQHRIEADDGDVGCSAGKRGGGGGAGGNLRERASACGCVAADYGRASAAAWAMQSPGRRVVHCLASARQGSSCQVHTSPRPSMPPRMPAQCAPAARAPRITQGAYAM